MKHKLIRQEYYLKELLCVGREHDNYIMGILNVDCIYTNAEGNSITISKSLYQDNDYWADDSVVLELLLLLNSKNTREHPVLHWFYPTLNNRFWIHYNNDISRYAITPGHVKALLTGKKEKAFIKELFSLLQLPLETY